MHRTLALATTAALALTGAQAHAAAHAGPMPALGLAGDKTIVMFDAHSGEVNGTMEADVEGRLLGIDLRPATGQVVGVTDAQEIVEIDPSTGEVTPMSEMSEMLPVEDGAAVIVDFNPMADKLRFMSGTTNHRVDVESGEVTVDGSLAYEDADMHAGEEPAIVAAAYINSYGKPDSTAMYDIDATIVALIQQTSPNDGTLAAIGKLGIDESEQYGFDVATKEDGSNMAVLTTGEMLYTVDLETGEATEVGMIEGLEMPLRDLTVMTAE